MLLALMTFLTLMTTIACSVSDFKSLRIPNYYVFAILCFFAIGYVSSPESFGNIWIHVAAFGIFIAITYLMFCFGILGAGDAKYGAALVLWVGLKGMMIMMFYMTLVGGLLGVAALVIKKKKPFKNVRIGSWIAELQEDKNAVPYGIAITVGVWGALFHTGFLAERLHELITIIH